MSQVMSTFLLVAGGLGTRAFAEGVRGLENLARHLNDSVAHGVGLSQPHQVSEQRYANANA